MLQNDTDLMKRHAKPSTSKNGGMTVEGLKPEDFRPISHREFGLSLRKAVLPKKQK